LGEHHAVRAIINRLILRAAPVVTRHNLCTTDSGPECLWGRDVFVVHVRDFARGIASAGVDDFAGRASSSFAATDFGTHGLYRVDLRSGSDDHHGCSGRFPRV
jgi:hypothetical protein